jgi:hypothetical protein
MMYVIWASYSLIATSQRLTSCSTSAWKRSTSVRNSSTEIMARLLMISARSVS